jgi:hypothetical protein
MAYKFTNQKEPAYIQPVGEYVLQCVGFDCGLWPSGDPKIDLRLRIEGTGTTFRHTLSPTDKPDKDFSRWQCDQLLLAFELVGEGSLNEEVSLDDPEWLAANVVGQRAWAKVKVRADKKNPDKKYNDVERWLIGKALPEAPAPEPEDDSKKPQF